MTRLVLFIFLTISQFSYSQVDPAKADSLARAITSKQKKMESFQDSFIKVQESTYQAEVAKGLQNSTNYQTSVSAEEKIGEQKRERRLYILLGILVLLLVLLVIGFLRIRNKSKQS